MANNDRELFGRQQVVPIRPVTADMCTITWRREGTGSDGLIGTQTASDVVTGATNVTISYQQQVVRRRTLASQGGRPVAVIYPTQPQGTIQIQRLFADFTSAGGTDTHGIFDFYGWNICNGTAQIIVTFSGASAYKDCAITNPGYKMSGCTVTGYNVSAEAEGLTVIDNVNIEFLQMFQQVSPG